MFLIKCSCGSFMTITNIKERSENVNCQNCGKAIGLGLNTELQHMDNDGTSIKVIPDDAIINVSFNL